MNSCCVCCFSSYTSSMKFSKRYTQEMSRINLPGPKWRSRMNERTHVDASIIGGETRWKFRRRTCVLHYECVCVRLGIQSSATATHYCMKENVHFTYSIRAHIAYRNGSNGKREEHAVHGYTVHIHSLIERNHHVVHSSSCHFTPFDWISMLCCSMVARLPSFSSQLRNLNPPPPTTTTKDVQYIETMREKKIKFNMHRWTDAPPCCLRICISAAHTALYS